MLHLVINLLLTLHINTVYMCMNMNTVYMKLLVYQYTTVSLIFRNYWCSYLNLVY